MDRWVDISFRCLPLRSLPTLATPLDAGEEVVGLYRKLRQAADKHGFHNSYYLLEGNCVFHLTNHEQIGSLVFAFEGTVLTDREDLRTLTADLSVALTGEVCDWLVAPVVEWFGETVREAVKVEFDRFIAAGDLGRTMERLRQIEAASDAQGGFLGAWL